ncbi:frizzled-4 [Athalia rosae]|uniref:frizzled-4 n=1 Tax=Athalia rosae TaxID=37344 RepID=UPI0020343146|nr:frizzled-4 [Athalia rosae]
MSFKNVISFSFLSILLVLMNFSVPIYSTHGVCEPIRIEMCRGVGYNVTAMPNLVGNEIQREADFTLQTFSPLIQYGCSAQLHLFLCSVYAPMCTEKVPSPIGPCRGLCEQVRARCYPVLLGFGFPWPAALNCSKFPPENNHQHMCMEGPGEPGPANPVQAIGDGNGPLGCSWYAKSGLYVFLNRSGRCAATCDADVLWSQKDKRLTEGWIAASATVCLISVAAAILALLKPYKNQHPRGVADSVERAIACLALCHAAVAVGHVIRLAAGKFAVACTPAMSLHPPELVVIAQQQHQYLTQDGLSNPYCALVFLLRYYFGNAASVWWVVVCAWWCISTRRWTKSKSLGLAGGNSTSRELQDQGFGLQQGCSTLGTVASWGLPAVHTIAVLVTRDVDADELTGSCFVGQQSTRSLLVLVLAPQFVYIFFGLSFLLTGMMTLLLPRPSVTPSPVLNPLTPASTLGSRQQRSNNFLAKIPPVIDSQQKQKSALVRMGIFACVYAAVIITAAGISFYEWWNRDSWLRAPEPSTSPKAPSKPLLQLFLIRSVATLVAGVMAAAWIWWPNVVYIWRRLPPCKQPPHKCHPHTGLQVPVVRCYSAGSTTTNSHQIHHLNHLAPQHPLLRTTTPNVSNGQIIQGPYRSHKKHRKHRKHHSGSETQV